MTVEFDRDISPSPILIEPSGQEQKKVVDHSDTIVHDFDYSPTEVSRVKAFSQDSTVTLNERKMYKPIDNPNADPMPIAHTFGPDGSSESNPFSSKP